MQDPDPATFPAEHCAVERHGEPHALLGDCFYVSGAIPRVTDFETGQPGHMSCAPSPSRLICLNGLQTKHTKHAMAEIDAHPLWRADSKLV